ncbi:adenosine deaminase/editase [Aspergillus californicus]
MTGIVLVKGENTPTETLTCIAVTTGAKCLPASQIPKCKGLVLHDCHAEILAMRAFNFWLLSECHSVLEHERVSFEEGQTNYPASPYVRRRQNTTETPNSTPPFELHPDVKIYMYCTCAPCGDASMELTMAAQDDPTPWTIPVSPAATDPNADPDTTRSTPQPLAGRADFSKLGIVRRKPARADAESTKSKSCSDKIALNQVSSLLSYQTSLLVAPTENAYIAGLILPEEEITRVGFERCFGSEGRMKGLKGRRWPVMGEAGEGPGKESNGNGSQYGYEFRPFDILSIPTEALKSLFPFRKPKASDPVPEGTTSKTSKPGNISAIWVRAPMDWTPSKTATLSSPPTPIVADNGSKNLPSLRGSRTGLFENIINGVRQGNRASSPGLRGASALSRAKLWNLLREITNSRSSGSLSGNETEEERTLDLERAVPVSVLQASSYRKFKEHEELTAGIRARKSAIRGAKEVLEGWVPNSGDEEWGLEVLVDTKKRKR